MKIEQLETSTLEIIPPPKDTDDNKTTKKIIPVRQRKKKQPSKSTATGNDEETSKIVENTEVSYMEEYVQCDVCNQSFRHENQLTRHKLKKHKKISYPCKSCKSVFLTELDCVSHCEIAHEEYKCLLCYNTFTSNEDYLKHANQVHDDQPDRQKIMCQNCGSYLKSPAQLKYHIDSKCGTIKSYICDQCGSKFKTQNTLNAHKLIHFGVKQYLCNYCGSNFLSKGQLKVHERSHTGEKPFKCPVCGKAFSYRESLVTHSSIHTGIKPYICELCNRQFSCIGNLIKHRKSRPDTCGLPQFCNNKKIAPRASAKKLNNLAKQTDNNLEPTFEDAQIKIVANKYIPSIYTTENDVDDNNDNADDINDDNVDNDTHDNDVNNDNEIMYFRRDETKEAKVLKQPTSSVSPAKTTIYTIITKNGTGNISLSENVGATEDRDTIIVSYPITVDDDVQTKNNELKVKNSKIVKGEHLVNENNDEHLNNNYEDNVCTTSTNDYTDIEIQYVANEENDVTIIDNPIYEIVIPKIEENNDTDQPSTKDNSWPDNGEQSVVVYDDNNFDTEYIEIETETMEVENDEGHVETENEELNETPGTDIIYESSTDDNASRVTIANKEDKHKEDDDSDDSDDADKNTSNETDKTEIEENGTEKQMDVLERPYVCKYCPKIYMHKNIFTKHLLHAHQIDDDTTNKMPKRRYIKRNNLTCQYCTDSNETFPTKNFLLRHLRKHGIFSRNDNKHPFCCGIYYHDQLELDDHVDKMHKCKICLKYFRNEETLTLHLNKGHEISINIKKYSYVCPICGRKFSTKVALSDHERSSCGVKPLYLCKICNNSYHSAGSLKTHQTVHTKQLPHLCNYCGKAFRTKGQVKVHERKHNGETPFKCDQCPKQFAYRESLLTHMSMHTGIKRFMCHGCKSRFSCISNLLAHRKSHKITCGLTPNVTKPVDSMGAKSVRVFNRVRVIGRVRV